MECGNCGQFVRSCYRHLCCAGWQDSGAVLCRQDHSKKADQLVQHITTAYSCRKRGIYPGPLRQWQSEAVRTLGEKQTHQHRRKYEFYYYHIGNQRSEITTERKLDGW